MVYRLGFTGDVMLGRQVDRHQQYRPATAVWGNLPERLQSLDGLFINLECCLSTRGSQWDRTYRPFHFRADPDWAIPALTEAGVDYASLANNHLMDFEEVALRDTIDHLNDGGIDHAGAGRDIEAAREPTIVMIDDLRVGVFSFTDNTPEYAADEDSPGVAYADIDPDDESVIGVFRHAIESLKGSDPDLIVASLHWGPNMVEHPPDTFQRFAHWLVEQGVDLLHGHSAHIFQGIEVYDDSVILYDTGDFVDDYAVDDELRNDRGFLFNVKVDKQAGIRELRLFPIQIYDYAVHEADHQSAEWSRRRMRELSQPFDTEFTKDDDSLVLEVDGE